MKVGTNFVPEYLHNDHLGTLRQTTGTTGAASGSDVFTAFGERQAGSSDRFGYVGAWGYQSTPIPESLTPDTAFPYMHVGARYYDPSSGRFLQRDPIGIRGGSNVYLYAQGAPSALLDPLGLRVSVGKIIAHAGGSVVGGLIGLCIGGALGGPLGGAAGGLLGGSVGYDVGENIYDEIIETIEETPPIDEVIDDIIKSIFPTEDDAWQNVFGG